MRAALLHAVTAHLPMHRAFWSTTASAHPGRGDRNRLGLTHRPGAATAKSSSFHQRDRHDDPTLREDQDLTAGRELTIGPEHGRRLERVSAARLCKLASASLPPVGLASLLLDGPTQAAGTISHRWRTSRSLTWHLRTLALSYAKRITIPQRLSAPALWKQPSRRESKQGYETFPLPADVRDPEGIQ